MKTEKMIQTSIPPVVSGGRERGAAGVAGVGVGAGQARDGVGHGGGGRQGRVLGV